MIEGSSKDILIERAPMENDMGIGFFIPKDSFSIFDYKNRGRWPFDIPYKGIGMAFIINRSFEIAKENNIHTCFIESRMDRCKVHLVRVPGRDNLPLDPEKIDVGSKNRMVDLEIIFNSYIHPRSSLLRDFKSGRKNFREYGFNSIPNGGEKIPNFILSYTTKYDKRGDLPLSEEEAKRRSRLTDEQWEEAQDLIKKCVNIISAYAEEKKLIRVDGKYELFVDSEGRVGIADTFGNPEEDRYLLEIKDFNMISRFFDFYMRRWNIEPSKIESIINEERRKNKYYQDVSKQFLRNWYIDNGWKATYDNDKSVIPPMMQRDVISAYSDAILSFASLWSGKTSDIVNVTGVLVRPIEEVASELYVLECLNRNNLVKN